MLYHRANPGGGIALPNPENVPLDEIRRSYEGPVVTGRSEATSASGQKRSSPGGAEGTRVLIGHATISSAGYGRIGPCPCQKPHPDEVSATGGRQTLRDDEATDGRSRFRMRAYYPCNGRWGDGSALGGR